jgi:hypothetical protein
MASCSRFKEHTIMDRKTYRRLIVESRQTPRIAHEYDCECFTCQENDRLGYDADISDPGQYCRHGTFIGSWWGPDYMCFKCEMGYRNCDECGVETFSDDDRDDAPRLIWSPLSERTLCLSCRRREIAAQRNTTFTTYTAVESAIRRLHR